MTRTSNALFLQVLTAQPVTGVPLEVTVYDGANPATMLAELQGAREVQFQHIRSDIGSGSFRIARDDPKATSANIREGNLVKVKLHGLDVFPFWIESPKLIVAESGQSEWQIAGQSGLAYLSRASVYPPGWPTPTGTTRDFVNTTAGTILTTFLTEAQARGALSAITWDFDATVDSLHSPWPSDLTLSIQAGSTSVLDVAKQLAALGVDIEITPALVFRAYAPGIFGRHNESTVVWRSGRHIAGQVERVGNRSSLTNAVLVAGASGKFIEVNDPASQADPYTGRREGGLSFPGSSDPTQLNNAGNAQIALTEADAQAVSIPLDHGTSPGLYEPYIDYAPGDWVTLDVPGQYDLEAFQIEGLTLAQTEGGDYTVTADVNAVATDYLVRLKRMVSSLAGTGSGATGSSAGGLGYGAPPSSGKSSDTVVGPDAFGSPSSPGTASTFSRGDHDHGLPGVVDGGAP